MKKSLKLVAGLLAASMLMSAAACSRNGGSKGGHGGTKISADSPWYDAKKLEVELDVGKDKETEYVYSQLAGLNDDYLIVLTNGNYKLPKNADWSTINYKDYSISELSVIDRKTNETLQSINLNSVVNADEYIDGSAIFEDGLVKLSATAYNDTTMEMKSREICIDPATGEVVSANETEESASFDNSFKVGDYRINTASHWNDEFNYYTLYVKSPDGEMKSVDIKQNGKNLYGIYSVFQLDGNKVLVPVDSDAGTFFYELDLTTCEIKEVDSKEYSWIDTTMLYNSFTASDGTVYYAMPSGISKVDMKTKTIEEIFNYSWCGINRSLLTNLQIADIKDDKILLCGDYYGKSNISQVPDWKHTEFMVVELSKADKNPHAGKIVLELFASYGYTGDQVADAINKFNETNDKYFIEVTDRYTKDINYDYNDYNSDDEVAKAETEIYSNISNKLAMDILNGEGPDMFLDVSYFGQLNNDNYLKDLTPYIGDISSDKYFTNIIDISKVDGKLYNLPFCFSLNGIQTDGKYAGASGVGFTTEEYVEFLNKTLNGKDVITSGQAMYFTTLFNAMSEKFIKNGKADFTGPEFAALAEYVKDNVIESSIPWDEQEGGGYSGVVVYSDIAQQSEIVPAVYGSCSGYTDYFQNMDSLNGGSALLGIPSSDGRGPMAGSYYSIAISAQAYDADACGEFVKMLLSDEIQNDFAMSGNFVLNRAAFRAAGEEAVKYFNENSLSGLYSTSDDGLPENRIKFTSEHIDELEKIIDSCSLMSSEDSAINLILLEEMPAYFSGQKDLDTVLKVAQERVQKVLDERN